MNSTSAIQAGAGKGPVVVASLPPKGQPRTLQQISDHINSEFRKAGFDIETKVEGKEIKLCQRYSVPLQRKEALDRVLQFPELTDDDCKRICLIYSSESSTSKIYIASELG